MIAPPRYYLNFCATTPNGEEVLYTGLTGDLARLACEFLSEEAQLVDEPTEMGEVRAGGSNG